MSTLINLRKRLSFANVMSVIALFVALGGTGFAATQLGKNSVGTKQLKKEAVTAAKVRKGTLTGTQIKASTLGKVPLAADAETLGKMSASEIERRIASKTAPLTCDPDMIAVAGVCIEWTERAFPTTFTQATVECARSNRRLPSLGELVAFDITHFSEPPNPEWVESVFQNGATTEANVVFAWAPDNVTIAAQAISSTHRYRCVTTGSHPVPPPTP